MAEPPPSISDPGGGAAASSSSSSTGLPRAGPVAHNAESSRGEGASTRAFSASMTTGWSLDRGRLATQGQTSTRPRPSARFDNGPQSWADIMLDHDVKKWEQDRIAHYARRRRRRDNGSSEESSPEPVHSNPGVAATYIKMRDKLKSAANKIVLEEGEVLAPKHNIDGMVNTNLDQLSVGISGALVTSTQPTELAIKTFNEVGRPRCVRCGDKHPAPCRASAQRRAKHEELANMLIRERPEYDEEKYEAEMRAWEARQIKPRASGQDNPPPQDVVMGNTAGSAATAEGGQQSGSLKRTHDDGNAAGGSNKRHTGRRSTPCKDCNKFHSGVCTLQPKCSKCQRRHPGECMATLCTNCRILHMAPCSLPPFCEVHNKCCSKKYPLACRRCRRHHDVKQNCRGQALLPAPIPPNPAWTGANPGQQQQQQQQRFHAPETPSTTHEERAQQTLGRTTFSGPRYAGHDDAFAYHTPIDRQLPTKEYMSNFGGEEPSINTVLMAHYGFMHRKYDREDRDRQRFYDEQPQNLQQRFQRPAENPHRGYTHHGRGPHRREPTVGRIIGSVDREPSPEGNQPLPGDMYRSQYASNNRSTTGSNLAPPHNANVAQGATQQQDRPAQSIGRNWPLPSQAASAQPPQASSAQVPPTASGQQAQATSGQSHNSGSKETQAAINQTSSTVQTQLEETGGGMFSVPKKGKPRYQRVEMNPEQIRELNQREKEEKAAQRKKDAEEKLKKFEEEKKNKEEKKRAKELREEEAFQKQRQELEQELKRANTEADLVAHEKSSREKQKAAEQNKAGRDPPQQYQPPNRFSALAPSSTSNKSEPWHKGASKIPIEITPGCPELMSDIPHHEILFANMDVRKCSGHPKFTTVTGFNDFYKTRKDDEVTEAAWKDTIREYEEAWEEGA